VSKGVYIWRTVLVQDEAMIRHQLTKVGQPCTGPRAEGLKKTPMELQTVLTVWVTADHSMPLADLCMYH